MEKNKFMGLAVIVPVLTRAFAILSDLLVLIVTWMKTAHAWKTSLPSAARSRLKLSTLLLRDGEFIFALNERNLTYLRYSVFCVSMFSEVHLPRPAEHCFQVLCLY